MTNLPTVQHKPRGTPAPLCCRFYKPEGLDLPALLSEHGLAEAWRGQKRQHKLAFIVHAIMAAALRDSRNRPPGFFVPLHSQTLRRFIGAADTKPALEVLQQLGVVEQNRAYSSGRFSRSYRLAAPYREQPAVCVSVHNATLARRLAEDRSTRNAEAIAGDAVREAILANLSAVAVSGAARELTASRHYANPAERAAWQLTLSDLDAGHLWLAADDRTGRVFHNVTQCPRELRSLLTIEGEPAAEIDLANAQPFFLLSLYPGASDERERYRAAVTSGDFYAYLFNHVENPRVWGGRVAAWGQPGATHRDRFKKHFLAKALYSESLSEASQVVRAFRELFPWLASELQLRGPTALAHEMQRRESSLVLGRVVPRILAELPECRPISIHDGIFCQARFGEAVQKIFLAETGAVFGVTPRVKIKSVLHHIGT